MLSQEWLEKIEENVDISNIEISVTPSIGTDETIQYFRIYVTKVGRHKNISKLEGLEGLQLGPKRRV